MSALQPPRLLAAFLLAGLLAACNTPAATPVASPTPAATAPAVERPTREPLATPAGAAAPTATPAPAPSAPLQWLVYRREDGLYAARDGAEPPRMLAAAAPVHDVLPWAAAPDGSALAFVRAEGLDPQLGGQPSIGLYLIGAAIPGERKLLELLPPGGVDLTPGGEASMDLLPALASSQQLAWSPDGRSLAVASAHEGQVDLYAVTPDGGATRLTNTPAIETMQTWSPDGALVAAATVAGFGTGAGWSDIGLVAVRGDGAGEIFLQSPIRSASSLLAVSHLGWIDDTHLVVGLPGFFDPGQIWVSNIRNGEATAIFQGHLGGAAWSPAAGALAITAASFEGHDLTAPGLYIWRPGEDEARLVDEGDAPQPPVWSPTGEWVAFSAEGAGVRLAPMDPERSPRTLSPRPSYAIVWSPDGRLIATDRELWHLNGSPLDPLPGAEGMPLAWSDAGLYVTARDLPADESRLLLWRESEVVELDHAVVPFDARLAALALPEVEPMGAAGLLPESYRASEGAADGFTITATDPASGAEREIGVIPYEPEGITRVWSILPSPDGRRVAVAASGEAPATLLYLIEGGQTRLLSDAASDNWPEAWSPDGATLLVLSTRDAPEGCEEYTCPFDIYSVDVATGAETRLTATDDTEVRAVWSPSGDRIAFTRGCTDRGNESCGPSLYVMGAGGGDEALLAEGWVGGIAFAPDGQQIAYTQSVGGLTDIYVVPVSGGEPRLLAGDPELSELAPRWSPDGRWLAFTSIDGICQVERCTEASYVVGAEGGAPRLVRQHGERGGLLFSGWSDDGRLLLALRAADERARLLAYGPDGALLGEAAVTIPRGVAE